MRLRLLLAALLLVPLSASCQAAPRQGPAGLALVPLTVKTAATRHRFRVEIARTPEEQARGLMFRERLAGDEGMIFPMTPPRHASFWMKNTVIPLDIIFVRPNGTIARIEAETVPYSLEPIDSGEPIAAVLEIAGGRAAQLGIRENDRVSWSNR